MTKAQLLAAYTKAYALWMDEMDPVKRDDLWDELKKVLKLIEELKG